jgi:DNA-binding response OmpR family regulator
MSKKILIVDDEPYILRSLQFQLERIGNLDVITAADGEEAVRLIEEENPCLIFLDLMLPKKSGYEICQWIKTTPHLSGIHVIILSARGQRDEISKGIQCGADEYMTKPFEPRQILEKALNVLDKHSVKTE